MESRAQKVLEACGVKLGSVLSDVFGVSGRAMLEQLAANNADPVVLTKLARGQLKRKTREIALAPESSFSAHDAMLLEHQLALHDHLQQRRTAVESQIAKLVGPYEPIIVPLDQIPGVNRDAAIEVLGEIGIDASAWREHRHIAAWAGLCPGNHESAGKRKNIGARKGNVFLKSILVQAATSAVKKKGSYYQAKFIRISRRRGHKRAIVAVANAMLVAIYHMLRDGIEYRELGAAWFDQHSAQSKTRSLVKQLQRLGYTVDLHTA